MAIPNPPNTHRDNERGRERVREQTSANSVNPRRRRRRNRAHRPERSRAAYPDLGRITIIGEHAMGRGHGREPQHQVHTPAIKTGLSAVIIGYMKEASEASTEEQIKHVIGQSPHEQDTPHRDS